jgi:sialic acid synthase SpsE
MKLRSEIAIAGRRVADDEPVYIIGEMACGHQGDLTQALRLIDSAVAAKADCVQLQIFDPAANMAPTAPLYSLLQQLYFTPDQWREIMAYARTFDIHVSIFVYDEPSMDLALSLAPDMLKLNSSELSNPPLLIAAARCGLPFTLGTGASSLAEIRRAVDIALSTGGDNLILMHGVQNFPTDINDANVRKIRRLKDEFGGIVIFADHTDADTQIAHWVDLAAIGQGASMLEKHLILDRSKKGVDWQAALEPREFASYVSAMRKGSAAMGPYDFQPFGDSDRKYRRFQKKCLVAARDMNAGEVIRVEDVKFLRVQAEEEGISPDGFATKANGRRLIQPLAAYAQILPQHLEAD